LNQTCSNWLYKQFFISSNPFALIIINVKILSNFQKQWCTFVKEKKSLKKIRIVHSQGLSDTPPSSLMDSNMNPKVKTMEGEGVGARSLARNTLGVKGRVGAPGWD
jgi:hypothetical protein